MGPSFYVFLGIGAVVGGLLSGVVSVIIAALKEEGAVNFQVLAFGVLTFGCAFAAPPILDPHFGRSLDNTLSDTSVVESRSIYHNHEMLRLLEDVDPSEAERIQALVLSAYRDHGSGFAETVALSERVKVTHSVLYSLMLLTSDENLQAYLDALVETAENLYEDPRACYTYFYGGRVPGLTGSVEVSEGINLRSSSPVYMAAVSILADSDEPPVSPDQERIERFVEDYREFVSDLDPTDARYLGGAEPRTRSDFQDACEEVQQPLRFMASHADGPAYYRVYWASARDQIYNAPE
ncbi:NfeD family protein [Maricaulis sp. D1M11]|uniref:NfeD family protein n=1 Tax=Maricaulis sp. D1M11 TaxID=3076117 RepID=UPI0039B5DB8A